MRAYLAGVALYAPGLPGWEASRPVLAGEQPLIAAPAAVPPPAILPANERRRATSVVRLALAAAAEATAHLPDRAAAPCVFATANGDGAVVHAVLDALTRDSPIARPAAREGGVVSPTQFHNSVHNAAAGYWTIATGSRAAATAIGCHDATFAAALLKAAAELACEGGHVLLCAYDEPLPWPLADRRHTEHAVAAALLLTGKAAGALAILDIGYEPAPAAPSDWLPRDQGLARLAAVNPAGRALRLLESLARRRPDRLALPLLDGRVEVTLALP